MWDSETENIALTRTSQERLTRLDGWLLDDDRAAGDLDYDPTKASDDELCARYLGYLLRKSTPKNRLDTDLLKTAYTVFLGRQNDRELDPERRDRWVDERLFGDEGDGKHTLTLHGIREHTMRDLKARAETTTALLRLLETGGLDFDMRYNLVRAVNDTIVATLSMLLHIHVEVIGFSGEAPPALVKPESVVHEIERRAALASKGK